MTTPLSVYESTFDDKDCIGSFPSMNKNETLDKYKRQFLLSTRDSKCKIRKIIVLSVTDYYYVSNHLMDDMDDLWKDQSGKYIGGSSSDDPRLDKFKDWEELARNKEALKIFRETCYIPAIWVTSEMPELTGSFLVNTEGCGYARYVGFLVGFQK